MQAVGICYASLSCIQILREVPDGICRVGVGSPHCVQIHRASLANPLSVRYKVRFLPVYQSGDTCAGCELTCAGVIFIEQRTGICSAYAPACECVARPSWDRNAIRRECLVDVCGYAGASTRHGCTHILTAEFEIQNRIEFQGNILVECRSVICDRNSFVAHGVLGEVSTTGIYKICFYDQLELLAVQCTRGILNGELRIVRGRGYARR